MASPTTGKGTAFWQIREQAALTNPALFHSMALHGDYNTYAQAYVDEASPADFNIFTAWDDKVAAIDFFAENPQIDRTQLDIETNELYVQIENTPVTAAPDIAAAQPLNVDSVVEELQQSAPNSDLQSALNAYAAQAAEPEHIAETVEENFSFEQPIRAGFFTEIPPTQVAAISPEELQASTQPTVETPDLSSFSWMNETDLSITLPERFADLGGIPETINNLSGKFTAKAAEGAQTLPEPGRAAPAAPSIYDTARLNAAMNTPLSDPSDALVSRVPLTQTQDSIAAEPVKTPSALDEARLKAVQSIAPSSPGDIIVSDAALAKDVANTAPSAGAPTPATQSADLYAARQERVTLPPLDPPASLEELMAAPQAAAPIPATMSAELLYARTQTVEASASTPEFGGEEAVSVTPYIVQDGDNLWKIIQNAYGRDANVNEVISRLKEIPENKALFDNNGSASNIYPLDRILLPQTGGAQPELQSQPAQADVFEAHIQGSLSKTVFNIAAAQGIELKGQDLVDAYERVAEASGIENPDKVQAGQAIQYTREMLTGPSAPGL